MKDDRMIEFIHLPVPHGWKKIPFKDLVKKIATSRKKIKENCYLSEGEFSVIDQGQSHVSGYCNDVTKVIFVKNSVIVFGDHTKQVKFVDFNFVPGADGIKVLESIADDPNFLYYLILYLSYLIPEKGYARHYQYIEKANVAIPPVEYQFKLVKKIKYLFSEIEEALTVLDSAKKKLELYKQSILTAAIRAKLVPQDPNDEPASALLEKIKAEKEALIRAGKLKKEKPLPPINQEEVPFELPQGWVWARLGDIGVLARGKSKYRPRNDPKLFVNGKYPFVQTGDIAASANSDFKVLTFKNYYNDFGLAQSKLWKEGTLCITIAANIAEIGYLGFDACFPDSIVAFESVYENIITQYVFVYLLATRKEIESFAPATAQKNINLGILNELKIPLPPINSIKKIISKVKSALNISNDLELDLKKNFDLEKLLKLSILKDAFEGKLL